MNEIIEKVKAKLTDNNSITELANESHKAVMQRINSIDTIVAKCQITCESVLHQVQYLDQEKLEKKDFDKYF